MSLTVRIMLTCLPVMFYQIILQFTDRFRIHINACLIPLTVSQVGKYTMCIDYVAIFKWRRQPKLVT